MTQTYNLQGIKYTVLDNVRNRTIIPFFFNNNNNNLINVREKVE